MLTQDRALSTTLCLVFQANVCSTFIPVYCGLIPPTLQGVVSISAWPCPGTRSIMYCLWAAGKGGRGERPLGYLSPSSVLHCLCVALLPMTKDPGQSWGDSDFLWLVPIPTPSVWPFAESPVANT